MPVVEDEDYIHLGGKIAQKGINEPTGLPYVMVLLPQPENVLYMCITTNLPEARADLQIGDFVLALLQRLPGSQVEDNIGIVITMTIITPN
jgi:hypothetical protein